MDGNRIEAAVQRIEAALRRIGVAADAQLRSPSSTSDIPPSVSNLVVKHEELRETVSSTLAELDALIARLEQ